ncbi:cell number regulator 2 isoform X2 [Elaeis guineensis]|uniref:cell number regulator 2 isoform X2 n=1 Tax=Elaeis guineensis var. tenera TaxID=51953 RepID=UPI003C6CF185
MALDMKSSACGSSAALYALSHITCCQWIYSCFYRSKMRTQYCLVERPYNDCLVHLFCEKCGLCQEYRELKNRGFDMRIGWHANMARQAQGVTMPPVMQGTMMR